MKKRLINFILVFCLIASMIPMGAFATAQGDGEDQKIGLFQDISESDWYYEDVKYVAQNGIFKGTDEDTFAPDGAMTRGMYVTVLGRIAGIQISDYPWNGIFTDVDGDAYYASYIVWAAEKHITEGVGNGSFNPNGLVTREQMAVFAVRFFDVFDIVPGESDETGEAPKDLSEVSEWAKEAVLRLWRTGILKGDLDGLFNPQSNAKRAEGAALSRRIHQTTEVWSEEHPAPSPGIDDSIGQAASYFTVGFQSNGGTEIEAMTVSRGGVLSSLPVPQRIGFVLQAQQAPAGSRPIKVGKQGWMA